MEGKEAKLYATWTGSLEFNAKPKPMPIANVMHRIPIVTGFLALERNLSTSSRP